MLNVTHLLCGIRPGGAELPSRSHKSSTCGCRAPRPLVAWSITRANNLRDTLPGDNAKEPADEPAEMELNFTEGLLLLNDLRRFEIPALLMTGGEPLLREDCIDLVQHAVEIGLNLTLMTNGTLIDDRIADRLASAGLGSIGIILDGGEARHDRLHQQPGAFRRSVEAIGRCRERGIRVGVRFTLHQLNYMDLDAIFDLCVEQRVRRLAIHHLSYGGCEADLRHFDLSPEQRREAVSRIFARARAEYEAGHELEVLTVGNHADAGYLLLRLETTDPQRFHEVRRLLAAEGGNRAGCEIAGIDPAGNVHYDPDSWHYACGNVRERSFADIWTDPDDERLRILRDRYDYLPDCCQICRFIGICNGNSRTRAEATTGDWLSPDPACYMRSDDLGLTVPAECIIPDLHAQRHLRRRTADAL